MRQCRLHSKGLKRSDWGIMISVLQKLMHRAANLHTDFEDAGSYGWQLDSTTVQHNWSVTIGRMGEYVTCRT